MIPRGPTWARAWWRMAKARRLAWRIGELERLAMGIAYANPMLSSAECLRLARLEMGKASKTVPETASGDRARRSLLPR